MAPPVDRRRPLRYRNIFLVVMASTPSIALVYHSMILNLLSFEEGLMLMSCNSFLLN